MNIYRKRREVKAGKIGKQKEYRNPESRCKNRSINLHLIQIKFK